MARAHLQRRWRANTLRKRIEVYLPADKVAVLDALATARGASRAGVIADLITDASHPGPDADQPDPTAPGNTSPSLSGAAQPATPTSAQGYTFQRPRSADEKQYQ